MWWNRRFPETVPVIFIGLLRLKKRSTEKTNTVGKIAKRGSYLAQLRHAIVFIVFLFRVVMQFYFDVYYVFYTK